MRIRLFVFISVFCLFLIPVIQADTSSHTTQDDFISGFYTPVWDFSTTDMSLGANRHSLENVTLTQAMPVDRCLFPAVVYKDFIIVSGGMDRSGASYTIHDQIYYARIQSDGSLSAWSRMALYGSKSYIDLPKTLCAHTMEVYYDYLYIIGGTTATGGESASNSCYFSSIHQSGDSLYLESFSGINGLPNARSHHGSLIQDGYLVVAGGTAEDDVFDLTSPQDTVYVADIRASGTIGLWQELGTTRLYKTFQNFGCLPLDDKFYSCAGVSTDADWTPWNRGSYYSQITDGAMSYTRNANTLGVTILDLAIRDAGYTSFYDCLALIGGYDYIDTVCDTIQLFTDNMIHGNSMQQTGGFYANEATLPAGSYSHATCTFNQYLYVLGGNNASDVSQSTVYVSDITAEGIPRTGEPESDDSGLTAQRYSEGCQHGQYVYLTGGLNGSSTIIDDVVRTTLSASGGWSAFSAKRDLPVPLVEHQVIVHTAGSTPYMYLVGGRTTGNIVRFNVYKSAIDTNGELAAWDSESNLPDKRYASRLLVHQDRLYVLGGRDNNHDAQDTIFMADISTSDGSLGSFSELSRKLPDTYYDLCCFIYGDYLYLMSGYGASKKGGDSDWVYDAITDKMVKADYIRKRAYINTDGSLDAWEDLDYTSISTRNCPAIVIGNSVFLVGGQNIYGTDTYYVPSYGIDSSGQLSDPVIQSYQYNSDWFSGCTAAYYADYLYAFGGIDGSIMTAMPVYQYCKTGIYSNRFDFADLYEVQNVVLNKQDSGTASIQMRYRLIDASGFYEAWQSWVDIVNDSTTLTVNQDEKYGIEYEIRVDNDEGSGTATIEDVSVTFRVPPPRLATPVMTSPSNGATDQATTVMLQWQDTNSSKVQEEGYRVRYMAQGASSYTFVELAADTTSYVPAGNWEYATTYYWNVQAMGDDVTYRDSLWANSGSDRSFTTLCGTPTVSTLSASNVTAVTAQLNGVGNPNRCSTTVWFEWGETTSYGNTTSPQSIGSGDDDVQFNKTITSLTPETTYHYRAVAQSDGGTSYGADQAFTTPDVSPLNAPNLLVPTNGATDQAINLVLNWQDTNTNPQESGYRVRIKPQGGAYTEYDRPVNATSYTVTGLDYATTYYWNVKALGNGSTTLDSDWGNSGVDYSFTTRCGVPTVSTVNASNITMDSARLNGLGNPMGCAAQVYFEWGFTSSYGYTTTTQSIGSGSSDVSFYKNISGLTPDTTYHFRAVITSDGGTAYGYDTTFDTLDIPPLDPPVLVSPTNGAADQPINLILTWTDTNSSKAQEDGYRVRVRPQGGSYSEYDLSADTSSYGLSNLDYYTTYQWNVKALGNGSSTEDSPWANGEVDWTFTTTCQEPEATTVAASDIAPDEAQLNGLGNPHGCSATGWFEWGETQSYGNTTTAQDLGDGTSFVSFNDALTGLTPNTTYYFRAVVDSAGGTVYGVEQSFATTCFTPESETGSATGITMTTATLNGTANPSGCSGTAYFDWGETTGYGNQTTVVDIGAGTDDVPVSALLDSLTADTTYHFRLVVETDGGTVTGDDASFDTESATLLPPVLLSPTDGAEDQPLSLDLQWQDTNSSKTEDSGYKVRVKEAGGDYSYYDLAASATSYALSDLPYNGVYYWNVKALGDGSTTFDSDWANSDTDWSFTTMCTDVSADAGEDKNIPCDETSVTIGGDPTADLGVPPYTYDWAPTDGLDDPTIANPLAAPTDTTVYTVTVTDSEDCAVSDNITVSVAQILPAATITDPRNGDTDVAVAPVVTWDPVSGNDGFVLSISGDGIAETEFTIGVDAVQYPIPYGLLLYNSNYTIKIKTLGDGTTSCTGEFGIETAFTTGREPTTRILPFAAAAGSKNDFRTNIGLFETTAQQMGVMMTFLSSTGAELDTYGYTTYYNTYGGISDIMTTVGVSEDAAIEMAADGPFMAIGGLVDNVSSDPSVVGSDIEVFYNGFTPLVLKTDGWNTQVVLKNLEATESSVYLAAFQLSGGPDPYKELDLVIAGNGFFSCDDIISEMGGSTNDVWLLKVSSETQICGYARQYTYLNTGGIYPFLKDDNGTTTVVFPYVEDTTAFRSNLGLVNTGSDPVVLNLYYYNQGVMQASRETTILQNQYLAIINAIRWIKNDPSPDPLEESGYIVVEGAAPIYGIGGPVDNASNDTSVYSGYTEPLTNTYAPIVLKADIWQTRTVITNTGETEAAVTIRLILDGAIVETQTTTIPAKEIVVYDDIIGDLFPSYTLGTLQILSDTPVFTYVHQYTTEHTGGIYPVFDGNDYQTQ